MSSPSHHNLQNWLLLLLLTFIWGTSYILIKKGLTAFGPVELAMLRISISFLCSMPFALKAVRTIPRDKYFTVLQIGIFGSGAPALLFALSMTHSGSAVNGIINSLSPHLDPHHRLLSFPRRYFQAQSHGRSARLPWCARARARPQRWHHASGCHL